MLELRGYQERSLAALDSYLRLVTLHGAKAAFVLRTNLPYWSPPQLPGLPYVCLRIPTGGGKTLLACHAVAIAARSYIQNDSVVCLWLVPSNTIRDQTLAALRDRQHPYRQTIDARFGGQVRVMDLAEALYVQRGTLDGEACLIISTLAALRVEDTEGRKIYEEAGALQHHFTGIGAGLQAGLERRENGSMICSLANVLRLRRPLVIIDEAHNARTPLSFDTLARFNPSCIIEFTATPETRHKPEAELFASNVLYHVSAAELKAEEMVKLPIKLRTRDDWKEVVSDALEARRILEKAAREEEARTGEYIRPIILFQAQPRSHERPSLTPAVVKKCLIEDFRVPEEHIAIATGQTREIDGVDIFDRGCQIRCIITVQALKEGWDCSFAYVLCSVAEVGSSRAVEQILGRVLRMPRARRKVRAELNSAYAFVASPRFIEAANSLKDALIENGFQRLETEGMVVPQDEQGSLFGQWGEPAKVSESVSCPPDTSELEPVLRQRLSYDPLEARLTVSWPLTVQEMEAVRACYSRPEDRQAVERIYQKSRGHTGAGPRTGAQGEPFKVPALAIRVDGLFELFDESHILSFPWNLAECDAGLAESEFSITPTRGSVGEVDVDPSGRVEIHFVEQLHEQMSLLATEPGWSVAALVNWLDRQVPHPDIPQAQSSLFLHKVVTGLTETRGISVEQLARQKFRLRNAVEAKIDQHRRSQSKRAYQQFLFGEGRQNLEVSPELCFTFTEHRYSPNWYYDGSYQFQRHYFPVVGELKAEGEELECAVFLDTLAQVKHWVRNLERRPEFSFWLQTSTDRFYPDFVAMLNDGRILVVESKGEVYWSNDDSKEKRAVGELWGDRSGGRCLFVMPKGTDWSGIMKAIGG